MLAVTYNSSRGESVARDTWKYLAEDGNVFSYMPFEEGVCITAANLATSELYIPDVIDDLPVVAISREAFSLNKQLVKIVVPASVRTIEKRAFENCQNLKTLVFSDEFDMFDRSWISGCHNIANLVLPGQIPAIDAEMLGALQLESLTIGSATSKIGDIPFANMPMKKIVIHPRNEYLHTDGYGIIGTYDRVFIALAVQPETYHVPEGCLTIGYKAFAFDQVVRRVVLPEGVFEIADGAFANSSVEEVVLPTTLSYIGKKSFASCKNLKHIELPDKLSTIDEGAFQGSGLEELHIPAGINKMGLGAFTGTRLFPTVGTSTLIIDPACERFFLDGQGALYRRLRDGNALIELIDQNVSTLVVPEETKKIEAYACSRHRSLRRVVLPEGFVYIGTNAFRSCQLLSQVDVCSTLETIDDYAFFQTSLTTFHLPASFKSLGDYALVTCHDHFPWRQATLREITVDDDCMTFWVEREMLCERRSDGSMRIHAYFGNRSEVVIDKHFTSIAPYSFCCATGIHSLRLHDNLDVGFHGIAIYQDLTHIELDLNEPIEGRDKIVVDFVPATVGLNALFEFVRAGDISAATLMDTYDATICRTTDPFERIRRFVERLYDPYLLGDEHRDSFKLLLGGRIDHAFEVFAKNDYTQGFDMLCDLGYLTEENISEAIEIATAEGSVASAGHLLQMQYERFRKGGFDFDL